MMGDIHTEYINDLYKFANENYDRISSEPIRLQW